MDPRAAVIARMPPPFPFIKFKFKELNMSLRTLEQAILFEARIVSRRPKLRKKDLIEWSTGPIRPDVNECMIFLPNFKVNVIIPLKE